MKCVSLAALFLLLIAVSCKRKSPEDPVAKKVHEAKEVYRALNDLRLKYYEHVWKSPFTSNQKYWYWGYCSEETFIKVVNALQLDLESDLWQHWPGAASGPPSSTNWTLESIPEKNTYYKENFTNHTIVFATYTNGSFFIKIRAE